MIARGAVAELGARPPPTLPALVLCDFAPPQGGTMPYINLGSGDGLETQMTFSVHSLGRDGKLTPTPKGTVEVIQLVANDPHLARVRVTSVTDAKNDPIVAGDQLFNPTWGPGEAFVLAGGGRVRAAAMLDVVEG